MRQSLRLTGIETRNPNIIAREQVISDCEGNTEREFNSAIRRIRSQLQEFEKLHSEDSERLAIMQEILIIFETHSDRISETGHFKKG